MATHHMWTRAPTVPLPGTLRGEYGGSAARRACEEGARGSGAGNPEGGREEQVLRLPGGFETSVISERPTGRLNTVRRRWSTAQEERRLHCWATGSPGSQTKPTPPPIPSCGFPELKRPQRGPRPRVHSNTTGDSALSVGSGSQTLGCPRARYGRGRSPKLRGSWEPQSPRLRLVVPGSFNLKDW